MRNARLYKFHSTPTREEGKEGGGGEGAPRTTVSGKWRPEKKGARWENGAKSAKEGRWDWDTEKAKLGVFGSPFLLLPLLPDVLQLPVVEDEVGAGALAAHDGHAAGGVAALDLAPRPAAEDAQQKVHELAARARSLGRLLGLACFTLGTARSAVVTLC